MFLGLVLSAAASLRCAGGAIEIMGSVLDLPLPAPSWFAGRLWLQRLGYYKLTRPKVQADDWVWIVDHTVQIGKEKCLVILGIRLRDLPPAGCCVGHQDVEPIELVPVEQSNGDVVYQQLEQTIENPELKDLFKKLAAFEKEHMNLFKSELEFAQSNPMSEV